VHELRVVSADPVMTGSPYDEWGRLTRFLESARLAFARERELWASSGIEHPEQVRITAPQGHYSVALHKHMDAIDDAETLHGSVLVHSYALAEAAATGRLQLNSRSLAGIEDWGARLIASSGHDWTDVKGGLAGIVEAAVARNAFAHGSRTIDRVARARLLAAGAKARPVGSLVTLSYDELKELRARLLSLLNVGGIRR
jgi:hypothetical protein